MKVWLRWYLPQKPTLDQVLRQNCGCCCFGQNQAGTEFVGGTPDTRFTSANSQPLTLGQIARYAPSAMAVCAHASRSDRYTYLPTVELFRGLEKAGFLPFKANQSRCGDEGRREFTEYLIRFRQLDVARPFNVGDRIPEVVLVNSHGGASAYKLMAAICRLVCSNGLVVSESMQASIRGAHKGDIAGEVINASLQIANNS